MRSLRLEVHEGRLAVCRLAPDAPVPSWATGPFTSITRTPDELSVVCSESLVPEGIDAETGWRAMHVRGPLPFDAVGIAAALAAPLADAGISILLIATFDTDWLLVAERNLEAATAALRAAGHELG